MLATSAAEVHVGCLAGPASKLLPVQGQAITVSVAARGWGSSPIACDWNSRLTIATTTMKSPISMLKAFRSSLSLLGSLNIPLARRQARCASWRLRSPTTT